jgi:hypothetical protein
MKRDITNLINGDYPELLACLTIPLEITRDGACRDSKIDFFSDDEEVQNQAVGVCLSCPLMAKCFDYALFAEEFGVWGGTLEGEREKLRNGRPLFTLQDRQFAQDFRSDVIKLAAAALSQKYEMTERTCYRWKAKFGVEDLAS